MRETGIYKISNLINGKFYIGQSRDISTRWKAHTQSLQGDSTESVIRMAFAKYNLIDQVSKPGNYGNFKFEIIELCNEKELLEKEKYYIETLTPQYNVQLMGVNSKYPKRDTLKYQKFIQYHSLEKMGYFPGYTGDETLTTDKVSCGIYSKKRLAINMLGSSVVLILGGKPTNCKNNRYYLWSEFIVEDILYNESLNTYVLEGIENLMDKPIDLTDMNGFNHFRMKCGNFAYGLQSMKNKEFYREVIVPLVEDNRIARVRNYSQWIDDFIEGEDSKYA
jgi:group I intron endonuclease